LRGGASEKQFDAIDWNAVIAARKRQIHIFLDDRNLLDDLTIMQRQPHERWRVNSRTTPGAIHI
jgi:hypothetical protein